MTRLCAICFNIVDAEESHAVTTDMGLVGRGVGVVHLRCFTIRALTTTGPISSEWPPAIPVPSSHPPTPTPCTLCGSPIGTTDCLYYPHCRHRWVHHACISLFDFTRRAGCPLCPSPSRPARAPDVEGETYVADADLFSAVGKVSEMLSLQPVSATGAVDLGREWSDAMINTVSPLMATPRFSMHDIEVAFAARRRLLPEPKYATVARQLCYEYGLDASVAPPVHLRVQHQTVICDSLGCRCSLGDLIKMGLSLPIALRAPADACFFIDSVLRAEVMSREETPWRATFEVLVRAGIGVSVFAAKPRSYRDLVLIEFSMPVFLAAGGTPKQLCEMTRGMSADPVTLLSQFEMTSAMQAHITPYLTK